MIPPLIACLQDEAIQVRIQAFGALRDIGPPSAEAAVSPLLRCGCHIEYIVNALEQIDPKGRRAVPAALEALKETQPRTRSTAAFVLFAFDPSKLRLGLPGFIDALQAEDEQVVNGNSLSKKSGGYTSLHQIAAWALGQIRPAAQEAVPLLVLRIRHPSPGLPTPGWLTQKEIAAPYITALKSVDPDGKEAIPLLMKALTMKPLQNRPNFDEWRKVIHALGQYGPKAKAAVSSLRTIIKNTEKGSTNHGPLSNLHEAAIEALKKIDPQEPPDTERNKPAKKSTEK